MHFYKIGSNSLILRIK